jgi:hypothetical protein
MARDIAPVRSTLEDATPGEQQAAYNVLADWSHSLETALDRGGWSRVQDIRDQYLGDVIDLVDAAATADGIDWAFLEESVDAYPPGIGDHHCSPILANVVARCVIRTRIREDVDAIPVPAVEYLAAITTEEDGEWAWESTGAIGWAVGHPEIAVRDRTIERAESGAEPWAMGILTHATFADPEAGVVLLEELLESPDIVEDLVFVGSLHSPFEQDYPNVPQYWEPKTELEYQMEIPEPVREDVLAVIGRSIDPRRLRHFDDSYRFDLERAADEYGPKNDR